MITFVFLRVFHFLLSLCFVMFMPFYHDLLPVAANCIPSWTNTIQLTGHTEGPYPQK